jgi:hypothetical protein
MATDASEIIGEVTEMLRSLLGDFSVTLDSPASLKSGGESQPAKINLYLYQVLENSFAKNQEWTTLDSGDQQFPPLSLDLYYLLTPYAADTVSAHRVLSQAMQVLHDHPNLAEDDLPPALRLTLDRLSLSLQPMKLEELTRIWNSLQATYRLSVSYRVSVVPIRSSLTVKPKRVVRKEDYYESR